MVVENDPTINQARYDYFLIIFVEMHKKYALVSVPTAYKLVFSNNLLL